MKFLIDAQLPQRLARWLSEVGHDVVHTSDLPAGCRTEDGDILELPIREQRVVVAKNSDFVDSLILRQLPQKHLLKSTGNTSNSELLQLLSENRDKIIHAFDTCKYVDLNQPFLTIHQ